MADVLLLSDRCATIFDTVATRPLETDKLGHKLSGSNIPDTSVTRLKTLENIFFLASCAEHGSEHPLAKGKLALLSKSKSAF